MLAAMSSLTPCDLGAGVCFGCNDAGTIILLLFMVIPLKIVISSLNDQYGYSSFCTSALLMASQEVHALVKCLGVPHLGLLLLPLLLSWSLVCLYMTSLHQWLCTYLVFLHPCLSHSCVWIANLQWIVVTQACTVFLCCFYGFEIVLFWACAIGLQNFS